ncbi:DUF4113 domain-containing protein [Rheinheimera sediminis]|nr:DUF4113 domain-containing protein [Rheinheimera sp. YQF-1]
MTRGFVLGDGERKRELLSPAFTTSWNALPRVR